MTPAEEYRVLKERAVIGAAAPRSPIALRGKDRASYLHGLLTNDIRALVSGTGCYAAWLTPQGRMLTDMHVFETGDMILLDVPAELATATLRRLDHSLFTEDVQISDLSDSLVPIWVHGPSAAAVVQEAVAGAPTLDAWTEYQNSPVQFGEATLALVRVSQLGVPGFGLYVPPAYEMNVRHVLEASGVSQAAPVTLEAARVEAGYPLFGVDMTEDTIPLEAGIEDRAISVHEGVLRGAGGHHPRAASRTRSGGAQTGRTPSRWKRSSTLGKNLVGGARYWMDNERSELAATGSDCARVRPSGFHHTGDTRGSRHLVWPTCGHRQRTADFTRRSMSSASAGGKQSDGRSLRETHRISWPREGRGLPVNRQR